MEQIKTILGVFYKFKIKPSMETIKIKNIG